MRLLNQMKLFSLIRNIDSGTKYVGAIAHIVECFKQGVVEMYGLCVWLPWQHFS